MGTTVYYTKLGHHKGKRRLWLEGERLARAGVAPGQRFELSVVESAGRSGTGVLLRFDATGSRRVSRRMRGNSELPVIDILAGDLVKAFGDVERVRVVIRPGSIEVTVHHQERATAERTIRLIDRLQDAAAGPLLMGSIAHGGGVLDHALHRGLERAGIPVELAFAVEIQGDYLEASIANNPIWNDRAIAVEAPMQDVEWRKLPAVDVLAAGLPCTGASLSGRAKNRLGRAEEHETAGPLFVAFLAAIQALRPSVIVLENVPQYSSTASLTVIRSVLSSCDYELHETVLDGHELGSLERRNRYVLVAANRNVPFRFEGLAPIRAREARVADVLDDVPLDDSRWRDYSYLAAKETRDRASGKGFRRQLLDGSEDGLGTIGRGYAKGRSTEPFIRHPSDPANSRLLTPAEHARVKGIPEALIAGLPATRAHEILGQSVIHPAFEAVGMRLGQALAALRDCCAQHPTLVAA